MYVLNAAALSKPGAVHHLGADLQSHGVSVAVITETHLKQKHTDSIVGIDGFTVYRRDRMGRRGGGVAVHVTPALQSKRWARAAAADVANSALEIDWVRVGDRAFIAALNHPPRPTYRTETLFEYVEACVAEITHDFPLADIVIAGDVNQLSDQDVVERTGLTQIVHQPARGANVLDKIYVSSPYIYNTVRVVKSVVKSDHKAVVVFHDSSCVPHKTSNHHVYRRHAPAQHAEFLRQATNVDFTHPCPTASSDPAVNAQAELDHFYVVALQLLNQYYLERVITKTSRDPAYITPRIKATLRRKNKLMRAGRIEEANTLSVRIGQAIQNCCRMKLSRYNGKTDASSMWAAVRRLTGRQQPEIKVDGSIMPVSRRIRITSPRIANR